MRGAMGSEGRCWEFVGRGKVRIARHGMGCGHLEVDVAFIDFDG